MKTENTAAESRVTSPVLFGVWVPYAESSPPDDATVIVGSWRNTLCYGYHWSMSSSFEPGRHYNIDTDRTHWLALPPPPQPNAKLRDAVPPNSNPSKDDNSK